MMLKFFFTYFIKYIPFKTSKKRGLRRLLLDNILFSSIADLSKKYNFKLETIYDIGAHKGEWSKKASKYFKNSDFYLFEANKIHIENLKKTKLKYFIEAFSDKIKFKDFYSLDGKGDGGSGDSFYKELTKTYKYVYPKKIKTNTVNNFIRIHKIKFPDLIKLDTQGSELDILAGASTILKKCKLVYIECPIYNYNKNAPTLDEYLNFMKKKGFQVTEIGEIHRRDDDKILQIDLLFFNQNFY